MVGQQLTSNPASEADMASSGVTPPPMTSSASDTDVEDALSTLSKLDSDIEILANETNISLDNTSTESSDYDHSQSAVAGSERDSKKQKQTSADGKDKDSKAADPVPPTGDKDEEQEGEQTLSQQVKQDQVQQAKDQSTSRQPQLQQNVKSTTGDTSSETTLSTMGTSSSARSGSRRPLSEIFPTVQFSVVDAEADSSTPLTSSSKDSSTSEQCLSQSSEETSNNISTSSDVSGSLPAEDNPEDQEEGPEQLFCYNHNQTIPQRYCSDHNQAICLECAFELHRSCRDVEVLDTAANGRRRELEQMCKAMLLLKAEWESVLAEVTKVKAHLAQEKTKTFADIQNMTAEAITVIKAKEVELVQEAQCMYAKEEAMTGECEERVRSALTSLQQAHAQGEQVLASGSQAGLLRQFGKLKGRCEALADTEVMETNEVFDCIRLTSTWFDDIKLLPTAKLTLTKKPAVSKKKMQMSERGLETFKRISRKRRQMLAQDIYKEDKPTPTPTPSRTGGMRSSRHSYARSLISAVSMPSIVSTPSTVFLDGPQSMFEFYAGLESDKYPFGLGDICVMQPRLTILITYLTSDLIRVFPWRGQAANFTSEPLGSTLCCMTQLTTETVAVTSSNSDQLSIMKVDTDKITLTHTVSMKRQYRAITAIDYRTLALATDSKKLSSNVIVIVRFDSSDFRSFTQLKTIGARQGSVPMFKLLSKTVFKVPYSLCTGSNGDVIVSDSENKALLGLRQDGEKRFVFQPPKHTRVIDTPGGVASSPSGYIYLVDSCEQRILRFDRTGKFRKLVLSQEDGLEWPIGVACVDDSTLCVAEFYGQVKVFRMR